MLTTRKASLSVSRSKPISGTNPGPPVETTPVVVALSEDIPQSSIFVTGLLWQKSQTNQAVPKPCSNQRKSSRNTTIEHEVETDSYVKGNLYLSHDNFLPTLSWKMSEMGQIQQD